MIIVEKYLEEGKVKSIKLKKQLSQGILIKNDKNLDVGTDFTDYFLK